MWKPRIDDKEMSIFICCRCCFQFSSPLVLTRMKAPLPESDKQAIVYNHCNVDDAFVSWAGSLL